MGLISKVKKAGRAIKKKVKEVGKKVVRVGKSLAPGGETPRQAIRGGTPKPSSSKRKELTVGTGTTRKATPEEINLSRKQRLGTATQADFDAAGVSMPTRLGGTGREPGFEGPEPIDRSISAQLERLRTGTTGTRLLDNPIARVLGSPKTTAILAVTLGTLLAAPLVAGGAGKAVTLATHGTKVVSGVKASGGLFGAIKGGAVATLGTAWAIDNFILAPSELATWAAVDNIASALPFQINDLIEAVEQGDMTKEEAIILFNAADGKIEDMRSFVNKTTMLNPKMWASRKVLLGVIDNAEQALANKRLLLDAIDTEAETFIERQDRRDEEFAEAENERQRRQDERDQEILDRIAESNLADAEKTQFFEALRKRNAGENLTELEKEILRAGGIDPDIQINVGRSNLQFGLL